ncbi:hypothetical protein ACFOYU_23095 [Microvirga sp. GCM10011540]|uniref:hypothetical protein n=1 Tax=Microvirga sp. GCM10011540 TaxID=3317338 RepID=UPI00360A61CC
MTTFNPQDWSPFHDWFNPDEDRRDPDRRNREVLLRWCMSVAFCLCFASLAPPSLIPFTFAGLMFLAGMTSLAYACLCGDQPLALHLTAWDEAALSFVLSLGLHLWLGPAPVN